MRALLFKVWVEFCFIMGFLWKRFDVFWGIDSMGYPARFILKRYENKLGPAQIDFLKQTCPQWFDDEPRPKLKPCSDFTASYCYRGL